jgi:hypothetical protein
MVVLGDLNVFLVGFCPGFMPMAGCGLKRVGTFASSDVGLKAPVVDTFQAHGSPSGNFFDVVSICSGGNEVEFDSEDACENEEEYEGFDDPRSAIVETAATTLTLCFAFGYFDVDYGSIGKEGEGFLRVDVGKWFHVMILKPHVRNGSDGTEVKS